MWHSIALNSSHHFLTPIRCDQVHISTSNMKKNAAHADSSHALPTYYRLSDKWERTITAASKQSIIETICSLRRSIGKRVTQKYKLN